MSDITVTMGAKDEGLTSAIHGINKSVETMKHALVGFVGFEVMKKGAEMAIDAFKGLMEYAGGVKELSAQTGMSAESVMVWGQALKNAGLESSSLQMLMNRLQKAMTGVNQEGQPTNHAFERLGINLEILRSMKPEEQMEVVAKAIAGIRDPATRASIAMELFGKSGGKALSVFTESGALETARTQLGGLAENLGENVESLHKLENALKSAAEIKSLQFLAGFAKGFSGDMESAAASINKIDLSKLGESLGLHAKGAGAYADEMARATDEIGRGMGIENARKTIGDIALASIVPFTTKIIFAKLRQKGQAANLEEAAARKAAALEDAAATDKNSFGILASQINPEDKTIQVNTLQSLNLMGDASGEIKTNFDSMTASFTDLNSIQEKNAGLEARIAGHLEGAVAQQEVMNALASTHYKTQEQIAASLAKQADYEKNILTTQKQEVTKDLSDAQKQLGIIANANVPQIGERGAIKRAVLKAKALEDKADVDEAFGDSDKAKILRSLASDLRIKAVGRDRIKNDSQTLASIDERLKTLNDKLPTPALAQ